MKPDHAAFCYRPLIGSAEIVIRTPLPQLRRDAIDWLRRSAQQGGDPDQLAQCLNILSLLEVYRGRAAQAARLCEAQIGLFRALAARAGQPQPLVYAIQPWINLMRLQRWQNQGGSSQALYRELGPRQRREPGRFNQQYGIAPTLQQLCELGHAFSYAGLIDQVYWREYPRLLLGNGEHGVLQQLLQDGLNRPLAPGLRPGLIEILLAHQAALGKFSQALALLERMRVPDGGHYHLHFGVLRMYLAAQAGAEPAARLADEMAALLLANGPLSQDAYGLHLLSNSIPVFRALGRREHEIALLRRAGALAGQVGDEVLRFDALQRLSALEQLPRAALLAQFGDSEYSVVRRQLGLPVAEPVADDDSARLQRAAAHLAALDFGACAAALPH
jgi:hypothetical protein